MAENYKSAKEMAEGLEKKFREEEALGRMVPTTLGELKQAVSGQNSTGGCNGGNQKAQW